MANGCLALAELPRLAQSERSATITLVARLAEVDARRLYLGAGFSSLFAYCKAELKLSDSEVWFEARNTDSVRTEYHPQSMLPARPAQ